MSDNEREALSQMIADHLTGFPGAPPDEDDLELSNLILAAGFHRSEWTDPNGGTGWFEWFKMPENTTEIAYVHENGEVYDPARGWNPIEFVVAAAEGRVFRLVRAEIGDV